MDKWIRFIIMKVFKIIIDVLLLIDTIILTNMDITGHLIHEILGITMGILLLIHIVTNWNWIKNVTKNFKKVNKKTKIMYLVNILTMIVYFGAMIFGVIISHELFKFETSSNANLVITHIIFGRLAIIVMLLHIGMHLDRILNKVKNKNIKIFFYILYILLSLGISVYSLYTLTHSFQWMMVFGGGF